MNTHEQHKSMESDGRQGNLFDLPGDDETKLRADAAEAVGVPRLRRANRRQRECLPYALDELLPEDHEARAIWIYVEGLDFTPRGLLKIRAVALWYALAHNVMRALTLRAFAAMENE